MLFVSLMLVAMPVGDTPPPATERVETESSAPTGLPAQPTQNAAKPKKDKRVCKESGRSGMYMNYKVCKKQSEWDAEALKVSQNKLDTIDKGTGR